jgi:hypothetical protein
MNALGHRGTEDGPKYVCVTKLLPSKICSRTAATSLQAFKKHMSAGLKRSAIIDRITIQNFDVVNFLHVKDTLKAGDCGGAKASCPGIKFHFCLTE